MTHDAFNADTSKAAPNAKGADARIVAPKWNGQAMPSNRTMETSKTGAFKVRYADGVVVVKKASSSE